MVISEATVSDLCVILLYCFEAFDDLCMSCLTKDLCVVVSCRPREFTISGFRILLSRWIRYVSNLKTPFSLQD